MFAKQGVAIHRKSVKSYALINLRKGMSTIDLLTVFTDRTAVRVAPA